MRKIAILNQKGGVGKTTTAVNFSAALAESGRRVCLVDLDPQAHASLHVGVVPEQQERSLYDCLVEGVPLAEAMLPVGERLDLVPSHIDLAAAELELAGSEGREAILQTLFAAIEDDYDYLVIDCPPSLGILTLNALTAADEVLIPLQPHFLALHGLSKLLESIQAIGSRFNPRLRLEGVVLCMYDAATRLASEVSQDVEAFFESSQREGTPWRTAQVYQTRIRRNIRLAEAPSFGQSILQYAADSNGAADYRQLAQEALERLERRRTHTVTSAVA